jgi:hypothetical protein
MNGVRLAAKSRFDESPQTICDRCIAVGIDYDRGHGGGQQGTSTFILLTRDERDGVVVLINMDDADSSSLADELMKIVLAAPAPHQKKQAASEMSPG